MEVGTAKPMAPTVGVATAICLLERGGSVENVVGAPFRLRQLKSSESVDGEILHVNSGRL
jgi:hypothetical protein